MCDITQKAFDVMQVLVVECNTISATIGGNNCFVLNMEGNRWWQFACFEYGTQLSFFNFVNFVLVHNYYAFVNLVLICIYSMQITRLW